MSVFEHAVLGAGAERVAACVALDLARRDGAALVLGDGHGPQIGLPATPAARRVARRLDGRELRAVARGRLVFARPDGGLLAAVARRGAARCGCPVVLALTAPRDELTDTLLAESAEVSVVADPDGPLAALALDELLELGIVARAVPGSASAARWPRSAGARRGCWRRSASSRSRADGSSRPVLWIAVRSERPGRALHLGQDQMGVAELVPAVAVRPRAP